MRNAHYLAVALIVSLSMGTAHADDGVAELGLGSVIAFGKTDKVALDTEVLDISPSRIRVELTFVNRTGSAFDLPVMFPLPRYGAEAPSFSWAGQPLGFRVALDGKLLPFKTMVKAVTCPPSDQEQICADVTKALKAVGLTDAQIASYPSAS